VDDWHVLGMRATRSMTVTAKGVFVPEHQSFPLERIFRDAHALTGHVTCHFDTHVSAWGLTALGGEENNPTL
jgi:hypothetical protein